MNRKIPINRKRFPGLLVVTFLLLLGFGHATFFPDDPNLFGPANRIYLAIFLPVLLYFVAIAFANYMKTLFDKNAGLEITETGIVDNLTIFSCGEIRWSDITTVELVKWSGIDALLIKVTDPEKFLAGKNAITRRSLKGTIKRWGSPILISEKSVDCNINELKETISTLLQDYKEGLTARD